MKNYKVVAIKFFKDSTEIDEKTGLKIERKVNDEFYCTKERYEYLKANNAVKLVEVQKDIETAINEITEEEVQAVASAIVEESKEQDKTIEEVVNEIVEEKEQWAVTEEEDGNIHVRPIVDGEIIDTPIEKTITYKEPKPKKKKISKK